MKNELLDFITKGLFGAFSQVSSVMMPASFPLQLAEITRKFHLRAKII